MPLFFVRCLRSSVCSPCSCACCPDLSQLHLLHHPTLLPLLSTIIPHFTVLSIHMLGAFRCPRTSTWVVSGLEISTPGTWPSVCPCFGAVQSNVFPCSAQGSTPSLVWLCSKLTLHAHCLLSAGGQQGQLSQAELFLVTQPTFGCSAPAWCRWLHSGIVSSSHTRAAISILSR